MKNLLTTLLLFVLYGCASFSPENEVQNTAQLCSGSTNLPEHLTHKFETVEDQELLKKALGKPGKGDLCQGRVYQSKVESQIILYRAWNSTNPDSKFGKWWAFHKPVGKIATYRSDYEICYQWSPLDMLVSCTLKPEVKVVVGNGQSAICSKYLTYPASAKQQIFIEKASKSVTSCRIFEGHFSWQ